MTSASLRLAALGLLATLATPAYADVPTHVDGPVFAALCASVGKAADCPTCKCEAMTSTSSIGVTAEATDMLDGIVVEVRGDSSDGTKNVREVHLFLGDAKALVDGGIVAKLTAPKSEVRNGDWNVKSSQQVYDMCPGACDWDAVLHVHLFEVEQTWTEGPAADPGIEYTMRSLYTCFEHDKKPTCWSIELGMTTNEVTVTDGKLKRGKKSTRQRTWKIGGKSGTELVLGAYSGNGVKDFGDRSGRETGKKTMHFAEIKTWADANLIK